MPDWLKALLVGYVVGDFIDGRLIHPFAARHQRWRWCRWWTKTMKRRVRLEVTGTVADFTVRTGAEVVVNDDNGRFMTITVDPDGTVVVSLLFDHEREALRLLDPKLLE